MAQTFLTLIHDILFSLHLHQTTTGRTYSCRTRRIAHTKRVEDAEANPEWKSAASCTAASLAA